MKEYKIVNKYYKNHVNTTFAYPIEVPEHIEAIEMYIDVDQAPRPKGERPDLVGVGIRHKGVVRAWNCTHKRYMKLALEYGTPGTLPGEIEAGLWEVVVFPRTKSKIIEIEVTVRVVLHEKHGRYVAGDPHIHTEHSDGRLDIFETAKRAKDNGLDYIFFADHNIASVNQSIPVDRGILIGPGVEYGLEAGHSLILGVKTPIDDFTWDPQWQCYEGHLEEARHKGACTGINHPFWEDTSWDVSYDLPHDWLEVWNGEWCPHNQQAVNYWHEQLCQGKHLPAVGGSDCHGGHTQGIPTSHVYVEALTVKDILDGYTSGGVYVTATPKGPKLNMYTRDARMGQLTGEEEINIELSGLSCHWEVHVITDLHHETYLVTGDTFNMSVQRNHASFCRVEVREGEKMILLSNPLYWA